MTIQRMDNVLIVVDDLDAVISFFVELGMELEGKGSIEGRWVERVIGIDDVRQDIAMLRTPNGCGRIELAMFHTPKAISAEPKEAPANTLGIRRVMFAVDDIEDVVARLRTHGAELVGELAQYEGARLARRPAPRTPRCTPALVRCRPGSPAAGRHQPATSRARRDHRARRVAPRRRLSPRVRRARHSCDVCAASSHASRSGSTARRSVPSTDA